MQETRVEKQFKHDGQTYIVEFDFCYDKEEYEAFIVRLEGLDSQTNITEQVFKAAKRTVDAEADMLHSEYLVEMQEHCAEQAWDYYAD